MMTVLFGYDLYRTIWNVDVYFNRAFKREWLAHDFTKKVIKEIDKSEIVDSCVFSPVLGMIAPEKISGGSKALIMLYENGTREGHYINLTSMGQNCVPFLSELSLIKDFTVCMTGVDLSFKGYPIDAFCVNNQMRITDDKTWFFKMVEFTDTENEGIEYDIVEGGFRPHIVC